MNQGSHGQLRVIGSKDDEILLEPYKVSSREELLKLIEEVSKRMREKELRDKWNHHPPHETT